MDVHVRREARGVRRNTRLALLLGSLPMTVAAAQPARARVVRLDTTGRDSMVMRVIVDGDRIERMIRELLASRALEQTIGYSLREAATGQKVDAERLDVLRAQLGEIARRNAGLITTIRMQCADPRSHPDGYLGVNLEQTRITERDNEPALYELGPVESVEPGSPAERAGILRGDILLSIGGVDARGPIALGTVLKPGAKLAVRVQRGRSTKDLSVMVEKRPEGIDPDCARVEQLIEPVGDARSLFRFGTPRPGTPPRPSRAPQATTSPPDMPPAPTPGFAYSFMTPMASSVIAGATVRSLDSDWKAALAVDDGVLVIAAAPGTPAREAGLRGSDVIITADGQAVSSPRALLRIIGEATASTIKLEIVRAGKRQTLTLRWGGR